MALEDYSHYFMYGGIVASVSATLFFYFLEKRDKHDDFAVRSFLSSHKWQGELIDSQIESWQQLDVRYGNDFFYRISFYLLGEPKLYYALARVKPGQMHLIQKGVKIKVKKGSRGRMAIMEINP